MKRWPTPGRITLAVLLLGTAVAALILWPQSCLFEIPSENIVGFEEAQGLFYTTCQGNDGQVVSSYDLAMGVKRSRVTLSLLPVRNKSSLLWPCRLSGDKRFVIAASDMSGQPHVLKLPSLTPVRFEVPLKENALLMVLGMSQDGGALLLRSLGNQSNLVQVLDLDRAIIQTTQIASPLPTGFSGGVGNTIPAEEMHMTSDRRYFATSLISGSNVLYDMIEQKEILRTKDTKGIPRFTPDGLTLVILPGYQYRTQEVIWYRLENGAWSESASRMLHLDKDETIQQACDNYFVTIKKELIEHAWLNRLPDFIHAKVGSLLPSGRLHFRFWDLETGQLIPEHSVVIPFKGGSWLNPLPGYPLLNEELTISDDGRYLAVKNDKVITVWETQPHRSVMCWLVCCSIAILALWLAWPRKVKLA